MIKDLQAVDKATPIPLDGLADGSLEAQQRQTTVANELSLPVEAVLLQTGITFRLIPSGSFIMGDPDADATSDAKPHHVTLTRPFYCGKYPITTQQWKTVMKSLPDISYCNDDPVFPINYVSWEECQEFCRQLCELEGVPKGTYRLLTEAEWEYACRAGTTTPLYSGNLKKDKKGICQNLEKIAWMDLHPAGMKQPNAWGLYDMLGNVWEHCQDYYGDYPKGPVIDPEAFPDEDGSRVQRGNDCAVLTSFARAFSVNPAEADLDYGFRIARTIPQEKIIMPTSPLKLDGAIYPPFMKNGNYDETSQKCVQDCVRNLLETATSTEHPGMLLGMIQSGKTRAFLGATALAFDNGYDLCIVLTKGTNALASQTVQRVKKDFKAQTEAEQVVVYDVMSIPELTLFQLEQKIIIVCKKEDDNLKKLRNIVFHVCPQLSQKRTLIIDDEADFGSVAMRRKKGKIETGVLWKQIDEIRQKLKNCSLLQVTATPYSLYLQPEGEMKVEDVTFKPIRPAFTVLVPVHGKYVGGKVYFEESLLTDSMASHLHVQVSEEEMARFEKEDGRKVPLSDILTTPTIAALRKAIVSFTVGGCIRRLQQKNANEKLERYSFLMHTQISNKAQAWQKKVLNTLVKEMQKTENQETVRPLINTAYQELAKSIAVSATPSPAIPALSEVDTGFFKLLGQMGICAVNSENDVSSLLDAENGELELLNPLNVFIGGFILDRGLTIKNLIGFFYGRSPKTFQQDTVLQHARMYGARTIQDLAVTRFYTTPRIYDVMKSIHEMDTALREEFEKKGHAAGVIFIRRDKTGVIKPCSPNKIMISDLIVLGPHKTLVPYGFQTGYNSNIKDKVKLIADKVADIKEKPEKISLEKAEEIIRTIRKTLCFDRKEYPGDVPGSFKDGYNWDVNGFVASMRYASGKCDNPEDRDKVWVIVRCNRDRSRFRPQDPDRPENAPYTGQSEGKLATDTATNLPVLLLLHQNGKSENGWLDAPFWWPVMWMPKSLNPVIFSEGENESAGD